MRGEVDQGEDEGHGWNYKFSGLDWTDGSCANGTSQSPIAIALADVTPAQPGSGQAGLQFGTASGLHILNTGHGIQLEWDRLDGANATVPVSGEDWGAPPQGDAPVKNVPVTPLQFHFHHTNEHLVNGEMAPLELHIVTKADPSRGWVPQQCRTADCLAVFGVVIKYNVDPYGNDTGGFYQSIADMLPLNEFLPLVDPPGSTDFTQLPKDSGVRIPSAVQPSLDLASLLPADKSYVTYSGSLTTPPCTQGVLWHVFTQPVVTLTIDQVLAYQEETASATGYQTTNRAVQPINGRPLLLAGDAEASAA